MFGKVMSMPDNLIVTYFAFVTNVSPREIGAMAKDLKDPSTNPRDMKIRLAKTIVGEYHSQVAAEEAAKTFDTVFRQKQPPADIDVLKQKPETYDLLDIVVTRTKLIPSRSEARRLIAQGGVKKNQITVRDPNETISPADGSSILIQVGPRRFLRLEWIGS